jgi:MFS family permease
MRIKRRKFREMVAKRAPGRWFAVIALSSAALVDSMEGFGYEILWPYMYRSLGLAMSMLAPVLSVGRFIGTVTTPIWGAIADRYSRKWVLVVMTGIWGLWTGMVGFVNAFWQLMAVRLAASLGLAVLYPVAYSIISDLFPREERGKAIGVLGAFGFSGSMVSTVVLASLAAANPEAWRYGFIAMGVLSFITGVMMMFIKEPVRGAMEPELADVISEENEFKFELKKVPSLLKVPTYWIIMVDEIFDAIGFAILTAWAFTWLDMQDLGPNVAFVMLLLFLGIIFGQVIFGWVSDKLDARYPRYGRLVLGQVGLILSVVSILGFLILGGYDIVYLLITGLLFGISFPMKETAARIPLLQNILLPELRATGRALIELIKGLMLTGAIAFSGWLLNRLGEDLQSLMLLMVPTTMFVATVLWIFLYRTYPRDLENYKSTLLQAREVILSKEE